MSSTLPVPSGLPDGVAPGAPAQVLVVCTGNVCRSPAAERLLAVRLGGTVAVASAGTRPLVGQPIADPMLALLTERGANGHGFRARAMTEPMLRAADLVLPVTREHRALVVELWPAAVRRTFTLREFARLLDRLDPAVLPSGTPGDRLRAAIPLAAAERSRSRAEPGADDVIDPYGSSERVYAESLAAVEDAVQTIARVILPPPR